ncbi:hypothetical protein B9132_24150 [Salmonella enterica subsp. enterica serovar Heidelberg]|nr:hypothetical protein [Salmonella enterica subsp. enterica serovar Heidelberg]
MNYLERKMISIKSYFNWNKLFVFLAVALYWFWRILYRSTKLMPVMLLVALVMAFYFVPEQLLTDVINTWESATTDEKITLARIFLKSAFLLSFASCFLDELITYPQKGKHKL